jgi:hypothetical protein
MRINRMCWGVLLAAGSLQSSGCGSATDLPDTGEIRVAVTTSGPEPDGNGYRVQLDGTGGRSLGLEDSTVFEQVSPGSHGVALSDLADNCATGGESTRSLTVAAGATEHVAFQVTCTATAALRVITRSEGTPADPDGYQLLVPGRGKWPMGANESITMTGLRPGASDVELTDLVENCSVAGSQTRPVTLVAGDTIEVTFRVACSPSPGPSGGGTIIVTVRTQAVNAAMPTGYTLTLDGGRPTHVLATQSVTLTHVPAGRHWVKLTGAPSWCAAGAGGGFPGANPVSVSVAEGSVTTVAFGVLCLG